MYISAIREVFGQLEEFIQPRMQEVIIEEIVPLRMDVAYCVIRPTIKYKDQSIMHHKYVENHL